MSPAPALAVGARTIRYAITYVRSRERKGKDSATDGGASPLLLPCAISRTNCYAVCSLVNALAAQC